MRKIIIFSGTTEGKKLSEQLSAKKIRHRVCVATDYGREMMEETPYAEIHVGRMDQEEMTAYITQSDLQEESVVVDATHPYATRVTELLLAAAKEAGATYIRILRQEADPGEGDCLRYEDVKACAEALNETTGNILLTTGSKELGTYLANCDPAIRERTYVRVLPSAESLMLCEKEGVRADHIIAMHGPFSRELNEAILRQYDICHLVTKDGGAAGGFIEKLEAARSCDAKIHVIVRPKQEKGITVEEALKRLEEFAAFSTADTVNITSKKSAIGTEAIETKAIETKAIESQIAEPETEPTHKITPKKTEETNIISITLVGIGMGSPEGITLEAAKAIQQADAVFGAKRLLQKLSCKRTYEMYRASEIIPVLEAEKIRKAAIVFSGDTGFYSGAKAMRQALSAWREDIKISILPGISSFAALFAKAGESYEDAVLYSLHGKNTEEDISSLAETVAYAEKTFALLSGGGDVAKLAEKLLRKGIPAKMTVGANLSYENESIRSLTLEEATDYREEGVVSVLIQNEVPMKKPVIPVRKDGEFIRDKVPMTKETIRHESILRLELKKGDILYDIGGGTGSVAIEAAGLDPSLRVWTIEKKKEAADLIRANLEKAGLGNVTLLEEEATTALEKLEKPDCVFIGGSGGRLSEIMKILHAKGEGIRFVINAVSLETVEEIRKILKDYEIRDEEAIQIAVTELKKAGSYHMMNAQNPVWIFSFTL